MVLKIDVTCELAGNSSGPKLCRKTDNYNGFQGKIVLSQVYWKFAEIKLSEQLYFLSITKVLHKIKHATMVCVYPSSLELKEAFSAIIPFERGYGSSTLKKAIFESRESDQLPSSFQFTVSGYGS